MTSSLLLGLSRKPLPAEDRARGATLAPGQEAPSRQALALLASQSLSARAELAVAPLATGTELLAAPPPHPDYGPIATALTSLLEDTRRLHAKATPYRFLARRGLLFPAGTLVDEVGRLRTRRPLTADDFHGLGPRGTYLFPLVERSPYREASSFTPEGWDKAFAETAPKYAVRTRTSLIGLTLGLLGAVGLPEETKAPFRLRFEALVTEAAWPELTQAAAMVLLGHDRLAATLAPAVLAKALPTDAPAEPLATPGQYALMTAAAALDADFAEGAFAKTRHAASDFLTTAGATSEAPPADRLDGLAAACLLLGASATAARLFTASVTSDNALLKRHPALGTLLRAMDAPDFARCVEAFAEASPRGWDDPLLPIWLARSPHALGPDASERLAVDAMEDYGFGGGVALAKRFPLSLDPSVAEVLHAFEERGRGVATARRLSSVLAQAALVNAAYPPLAPPYAP